MIGQFLSSVHIAELARLARQRPNPWLLFDPSVLKESYNQRPFILRHRLSEHPLFQIDELFALCRRLPPSEVRVRVGKVPSDADFDSSLGQYNLGLTIQEVIEHVEEKQAYIAIYNPERDPDYKVAIEEFLGEIDQHIEALEAGLNWYSTYVFISARNSVTPYHMDREMNFLLQIRGTKTVKLWDPFDDEVMPAEVKDRLLAVPFGSRPPYRPGLDAKAMVFELQPGLGIHHPFIAPHLVTTGPTLSISLAITFRTARSDVWSEAHAFNHRLRRLGFRPGPVRHRPHSDETKARVNRVVKGVRKLLRRASWDVEES